MIDTSFLATLVIIILGALLGSYLRATAKDRCLDDFDRYHVTIEKKDGRIIWGDMHLEPTGIELEYEIDVQDQAHVETSYLLYKSEYKDLQAIYRYVDDLTLQEQQWREKDVRSSFHPHFLRRLRRQILNFVSRATDSLSEAMPLITGQVKKPAGRYIAAPEEAYLQKLGKNIIGYVGTSFDPLLERYIGAKVVAEVLEGGTTREYVGILKDYSADFLEVLDVFYPESRSVNLNSDTVRESLRKDIQVTVEDAAYKIRNLSVFPFLLHRIKCGDRQGEVNAVIGPHDELRLQPLALTEARTPEQADLSIFFEGLVRAEESAEKKENEQELGELARSLEGLCQDELARQNVQFDFRVIRILDMIMPRDHALIRHKAERYNADNVFGEIGVRRASIEEENKEAAYRAVLAKDAHNVGAAVNLGIVLMQKEQFAEATKWFERALEHRDRLVDGGRLVDLELAMAKRKLATQQKIARE